MQQGIHLMHVKKTRLPHQCVGCGKPIEKGSSCLSANGLDYDDMFTSWRVHLEKKCYMFFVDNIDMVDENDILALFPKTLQK